MSKHLLRSLERRGIVRMGDAKLTEALKAPPSGKPAGVLSALLEERAPSASKYLL